MSLATCSSWSGNAAGMTWPTAWGTSGRYKIISDHTFVFNGNVYPAGNLSDPIDQNWCATGTITVNANVPTFSSFTLPQTNVGITVLNGSGEPTYTLVIYSNAGRVRRKALFQNWRIGQSLTTSFNFETLAIYNAASGIVNPPSRYLDANQVANLVAAADIPLDATYITQTPNSTLTAEQAMSLLGTGLVKNTTGTGVLSIAVAGTDYVSPTDALKTLGWYDAKVDGGMKGDGVTDDTANFQALLNTIASAGFDATIFFPRGIYIIAGALQDTSLSNSQIVLPKRNSPTAMLSIRLLGQTPTPQPWGTSSGSIIKSTLLSGNGAMIGVKNDLGYVGADANSLAHNKCSWLSLHMENLTCRMPANPTNNCLDLRYLPNIYLKNVRVDPATITLNITNGVNPDFNISTPTTVTSYGIMGPINYLPNAAMYDNVEVLGFYTGAQLGELTLADKITISNCVYAVEFPEGIHPSNIGKLLTTNCAHSIRATGGNSTANIALLDIEHDIQIPFVDDISDASNYLHGDVTWFNGALGAQSLTVVGGGNLKLHQAARPFNTRSPFTEFTGGSSLFQDAGSDHAVDETYRGLATSDDSKIAWKVLTSQQSGTANLVGILAYVNAAIAGSVDKRLAQIAAFTEGATNSGRLTFYTMLAGVLRAALTIDKDLNAYVNGRLCPAEGAVLSISSNTITVTNSIHHVGAGLIKTITSATDFVAGQVIFLIPDAAFTYDTTGNIAAGGGGTATIGRVMTATYSSSSSKWYVSY